MTAALDLDTRLRLLDHPYAVQAVACPKCKSRPGQGCESTGGGNRAAAMTHQPRYARIAAWTVDQLTHADALVRKQGRTWWAHLPAGYYTETEAWAAPIVDKPKTVTPKGVRLSEVQAEEIERAALCGGRIGVSTAHFHGDAQHRQTTNALEAKGILHDTGVTTPGGWERVLELTDFGWDVYEQHRLIIHPSSGPVARPVKAGAA